MASGQIYLGVVSNGALTGKLAAIGNVDKLSLAVAEDTKELLDYTSAGGGTTNKIIRIKSIDASITLRDISPDNLAIALRGTSANSIYSNENQHHFKVYVMRFEDRPEFYIRKNHS